MRPLLPHPPLPPSTGSRLPDRPRRGRRAVRSLTLLLALALTVSGLAACTEEPDDSPAAPAPAQGGTAGARTLVGEVEGARALVAVVVQGERATVYLCGLEEAFPTVTGWFDTATAATTPEGEDGVVELGEITNAAGLVLTGTVEDSSASGTVTLADGTDLSWSASVPQEEGSGLFFERSASAVVGLVRDDEGRVAGSSTTLPGGTTQPVTITPTVSSSPTPTASPTPAPTGSTTTGSTSGTVTVESPTDDGGTRTTELTPLETPRLVDRNGPVVVFLVHGMSENLLTPRAGDPELLAECSGPRDTPFAGRCEWGPDFIPGLFGARPGAALATLSGEDVTGTRFNAQAGGMGQNPFDENLTASPVGATGCQQDPSAADTRISDAIARHWVTTREAADAARKGVPPRLSVFTTWRDSTRGMVASGLALGRQMYAATRYWEKTFGLTPQIVVVAQSFGGLSTRYVLSNPSATDIGTLNTERTVICPEDRAKADYLRDRTTYALTLATPHEGSFLATGGANAFGLIDRAIAALDAGVRDDPLVALYDVLAQELVRRRLLPDLAAGRNQLRSLLAQAREAIDSPALKDLNLGVMRSWNLGPLAPQRAIRTAASPLPGAAKRLVPIYATLARTPGDIAFDTPDLADAFRVYGTLRPKHQGWITSTSLIAQAIVALTSPQGWGTIPTELQSFRGILDRRARILGPGEDLEDFTRAAATRVAEVLPAYLRGSFGAGVDAVLNYLAVARVGILNPLFSVPLWLDSQWELRLTGRASVPAVGLRCGTTTIVLDHEPVVDALVRTFRTTQDLLRAITGRSVPQLADAIVSGVTGGAQVADGFLDWFESKAAQASAAGADCAIPLKAGNWSVVGVTTTVPAPAWVRTGRPVSDGEQDTDGAVHAASALGLQLGRTPMFFANTSGGSWYRIPDNPVTETRNHGLQYANEVGQWVRTRLLAAGVGPVPRTAGDSFWPAG